MGRYTHRCDRDYRNEGWVCVGQPTPWQCLSSTNDSNYIKCPATPQRVTVGFPVDLNSSQIPDNAVFTSVTVYIRCNKTTSASSPITVNVMSSYDTSKFTQATIYPTTNIATYEVGTYQRDAHGNPWGMWELNYLLAQCSTTTGTLDGVRIYELYSVVNYRVKPTLSITSPGGTQKTPSPTAAWTYAQSDGDRQSKIDLRVFTADDVSDLTFNPDVTTHAVYSDTISGDRNSIVLPTALGAGDYYLYARAYSVFNAKSDWAFKQFSVLAPAPGVPVVESITPDNATSTATLAVRDTSNMLSTAMADAETNDRSEFTPTNCTMATSPTQVFGLGVASWKMTASSAATMSALSPFIEVSPGLAYTASAQVKASSTGRSALMTVQFYDSQFNTIGSGDSTTVTDSSSTWTTNLVTNTTPALAAYAKIKYQITSPANAEIHYWDALYFGYGNTSDWSSGGHMSRNLLNSDYSSHPGYESWSGASGTTVANVTSGITQTGNNGPNAMSLTPATVATSITFVAAGTAYTSTTSDTAYTLNKPSGVTTGDLMLAFISVGNPVSIIPPTGWTYANSINSGSSNQSDVIVLKRTAGASEPATWTDGSLSQATFRKQAVVIAYRGCADASQQFLRDNVAYDTTSTNLSVTAGPVNNTDGNAWRLSAFTVNAGVAGGSMIANTQPPNPPSTISYVGSAAKWSSSSVSSFTINKPAGVVSGDLMIAYVTSDQPRTYTTPTGWTLVDTITASVNNSPGSGDNYTSVYKRTAGASEPNSWSAAINSTTSVVMTGAVAYRGADTAANQFIAKGTSTVIQSNKSTITTASVSNTDSKAWRVVMGANRAISTHTTTANDTSERFDFTAQNSDHTASVTMAHYDSNGVIGTGSTSKTVTFNPEYTVATSWIGIVKPAPSGPTPPANETQRKFQTVGSVAPWISMGVFDSNGVVALGNQSVTSQFTPGSGSTINSQAGWIGLLKPATPVTSGVVQATMNNYIELSNLDPVLLALANNQISVSAMFLGTVESTPYITLNFYRANQLLTTRKAQGTSFGTSAWVKSTATFDLPTGTTRITVTVSASGLASGNIVYVDGLGVYLGDKTVWRPGTTLATHPVWNLAQIQYADDEGQGYGDWTNLAGTSLNPPTYDPLTGGLTYVDQTIIPGAARKYRIQTQTFGLNADNFTSGYSVESLPITVVGQSWWLKDLADPTKSLQLLVKADGLQNANGNTATVFQPLGRDRAIVVSDGFKGDTFDLTMRVDTSADYVALKNLIKSGHTLFLQSDVDRAWWVRPVSDIEDVTIVTYSRQTAPLRWVKVTFQEVDPVA